MTNIPPPAEELRLLDWELHQLEARRTQLLRRRAWLLGVLRAAGPAGPPPRPVGPPTPEAAPPSAQNILLTLGGVLLTIAAIAFTVVSWGHLGIAGRGAVLGLVTLAALGAPALLLRRSLRSTAEAVAGLGLALTVLDSYALRHLALRETETLAYEAGTSAVLATLWAGYGLLLGALRLPLPTAVATAQLPLLLWAGAADAGDHAVTAALLVTAAFDTALALWATVRSVRVVAAVGGCTLGLWGAAGAGLLSARATDPTEAARAGVLLLFAALIVLVVAWRAKEPRIAMGAVGAAGLLVVAASGGVLRSALPPEWTVPGYLVCGVALAAAVRTALPRPVRLGAAGASTVVQGLAVLWALPVTAVALLGPLGWATRSWTGAPSDARAALLVELPLSHPLLAPLVLATSAAFLLVVSGALGRGSAWLGPLPGNSAAVRSGARLGALTLAWAAAVALPPALRLPYAAGPVAQLAVTAVLLAVAARATSTFSALTASALALVSSVSVAFLALSTEAATLGTLGALTALYLAACGWTARRTPSVRGEAAAGAHATPAVGPGAAALAACATVAYATALACAAGAAAGLRLEHVGLAAFAVPALAAFAAARLGRHPLALPVEIMAAASGALALTLTAGHAPTLALALSLCGLVAAGTALRPDRRPVGYAAGALLLLASWVRLASWGVVTPEAYTLPATVPALLLGRWRRRREPEVSSWEAYGPGLALTLLPSLAAAWGDAHWQRPLLLGAAALALTLIGARHRLRAPLVLGGTVLALDALHELAPYLVQVAGALPRWLPPALAGLLLLGVGATYEQRLRDARRLRNALGRMH
ncbi:SCO7613 C-terminal domain-containing membrane protein [Streptomyces huasconensis]|uniref:SCO7613 C-terminal domain-containing membrane protein n=1 Tax=Streptomyces huasconensis TaxID=1854574 RepID=UPI0036F64F86